MKIQFTFTFFLLIIINVLANSHAETTQKIEMKIIPDKVYVSHNKPIEFLIEFKNISNESITIIPNNMKLFSNLVFVALHKKISLDGVNFVRQFNTQERYHAYTSPILVSIEPGKTYSFEYKISNWSTWMGIEKFPVKIRGLFRGFKHIKGMLLEYANWNASSDKSIKKSRKLAYKKLGSPSLEKINQIIGTCKVISNPVTLIGKPVQNDIMITRKHYNASKKETVDNQDDYFNPKRTFITISVIESHKDKYFFLNGSKLSFEELEVSLLSIYRHYKGRLFTVIIYDNKKLLKQVKKLKQLCEETKIKDYKIVSIKDLFNNTPQ